MPAGSTVLFVRLEEGTARRFNRLIRSFRGGHCPPVQPSYSFV